MKNGGEQLLDAVLVISSCEAPDGEAYAVTRVFRFDIEESRVSELLAAIDRVAVHTEMLVAAGGR
jgi:hypothetical protein